MKKFIVTAAVVALAFVGNVANTDAYYTYNGGLLTRGSSGADVYSLQVCLAELGNNPDTNIDGMYGPITASAVRSFQLEYNMANDPDIYVDGIVGPQTGPLYQAACEAEYASDMGMDSDDEDMDDDSDDDASSNFPTFGGDEASLEDFDLSSEDDAQENSTEHVATIEFDVEDGDIMIERLDLTFKFAGSGSGDADDEPWDVFESLILTVDGDEIAEEDIDDEDDWRRDNSPFVFRLTGLDYVVEEGDTAEIEVHLATQNNIDDASNAEWIIYVDDEGIRGVDTAGITQYVGDKDEKVSFGVDEEGGDEEIKIKSSNNDPNSSLLRVDEDDEKWHEVFVFQLEAEENDIEVDELELEVMLGNVDYNTAINDMKVEMNGDEVDDFDVVPSVYTGTCSDVTYTNKADCEDNDETWTSDPNVVTVTFDIDGDFEIDADDKEDVTVHVEFKKADQNNDGTDDGVFDTTTVKTIQVGVRSVDGEGVDDVDATSSITGSVHTLTLADVQVKNFNWSTSGTDSSGVIDFTFTVDNTGSGSDEDFVLAVTSILDSLEGDAFEDDLNAGVDDDETSIYGTVSRVSGDTVSYDSGEFTVDSGDSANFRVRYVAQGAGVYEVSISEVAGVELDNDDELSPTLILE